MKREKLEKKLGSFFTEVVKEAKLLELLALQHDLRKTQPEDKYHLELILLELKERDKIKNE